MKEFVEKLISRLEEYKIKRSDDSVYGIGVLNGYSEAIEIVNQLAEEYKDKEVLNMAQVSADYAKARLEELKRISNNGWIHCSERLPESGKRYLVSVIWKDELHNYRRPAVYDAVFGSDGLWHTHNYEPVRHEVIAWQPLPEPYKESEVTNGINKSDKRLPEFS